MTEASPLWPARLHHLRYDSPDPEAMVRFHGQGFAMAASEVAEGVTLLGGGARHLLIGRGEPGLPFHAFAFENAARLAEYRAYVQGKGLNTAPSPTPLFADDAFALHDPDGRRIVFGVPLDSPNDDAGQEPDELPGRLQHFAVATTGLQALADYYADALGFLISDWVRDEDGEPTGCFLRSDDEHHSIALFRAPENRPDHHSFEVPSWNDIRDWADHMGDLRVPLWWGPGRHGVGNNLFFMVEDPDGNKAEISSELEHVAAEIAPREWPHGERALNLWGAAWMRS